MTPIARSLLLLSLCAVVAVVGARAGSAVGGAEPGIVNDRAASLRFAPAVPEADRAWIVAAITAARPEARRLIDEVDGAVVIDVLEQGGDTMGWAQSGPGGSLVSLNLEALDGERIIDRNVVVLHELGHVVDYRLVPDPLRRELDAGIPRPGVCTEAEGPFGACAAVEERFADTFAKWALRGAASLAGSGYQIPAPPSLEDWGAPLGRLATGLSTAGTASLDGRHVVAGAVPRHRVVA